MKIVKRIFKAVAATVLVASFALTTACSATNGGNKKPGGDEKPPVIETNQLAAPHITVTGNTISWSTVPNASKYQVYLGETLIKTVSGTSYEITYTAVGTYTFKVKAVTDNEKYTDSEFSNSLTYTVNESGGVTVKTQLSAPKLKLTDNVLSWDAVVNASGYEIYMNNESDRTVTQTTFTIPYTAAGSYVYKVKATSSDAAYTDSEFSAPVTYTVKGEDPNPPTPVIPDNPDAEKYTVTFDSAGGSKVDVQIVTEGNVAVKPTDPTYAGKQFVGWFKESAGTNEYSFNAPVTEDFTLYAKWVDLPAALKDVKGYEEGIAVSWADATPQSAKVEYQSAGGGAWTEIDNELIRKTSSSELRADILGLKAGDYNVKITTSGGTEISVPTPVKVSSYDRSGYAHFKYTDGVGAYKDDGTLKDNALVIYVTDENKDTVMEEVCAENSDVNMFAIPTYAGTPGKDWKGKNASGIGWWLNNAQYSSSNAGSDKNKRPSNTYDPANGGKLGFKSVDRPIVIRILGAVTSPEGLTSYANEDEGGNVEDNGHMARMKNLKNITIEGVGEDAKIEGWGIHFMAGSDAVNGQGKSFEVRNLTFDKYPEDAIGMEGVQEGGRLTGSVERCWIHHSTFLPGYCANPAPGQGDKAEGDGSCDFKRGEYLTCSYNYFNDCHKTNLVGSSNSSLQYNLSYHHNWWHNCGSRIPLARQANIHFYNNYISTDTNVPAGIQISYVHSIRANAYIFSEGNYYFGCKQIADGGSFKSYNNTMLGCFNVGTIFTATNRDDKFSNACKHFNGTDLSGFDTDPNLFYYDAANKRSDCLLDDSVTARYKAIQGAGVHGWGTNNPKKVSGASAALKELMNEQTPSETVQVPETGSLTVDLSNPPKGVILIGSVSKGILKSTKGNGQIAIFTLSSSTEISATAPDDGYGGPYLIAANGRVVSQISSSGIKVEVPAGTYIITVGNYSYDIKQSSLSALSFTATANSAQERIEAAKEAINALPAPAAITVADKTLIDAATLAFGALTSKEQAAFDGSLKTKLEECVAAYENLAVKDVEDKINAIGTVTKNSGEAIKAAQNAYNALTAEQKAKVSNYSTLVAAQNAYENFAVNNVIEEITALADTSSIAVTDTAAINSAKAAYTTAKENYDALSSAQQAQVTNYSKLTDGLAKIAELEKLPQFKTALAAFSGTDVNSDNVSQANSLKALYTALTSAQKAALTSDETAKYNVIDAALTKFASQAITCTFIDGKPSNSIFVHVGGKQNAKGAKFTVHAYGGELASGAKFESTTDIKFTLSTKMTLTLYMGSNGNGLSIDGKQATVSTDESGDLVTTIVLEAGEHHLTRGGSEGWLYYATLTPAP